MWRVIGLAAVVIGISGAGAALAVGPFDGTWNAVVSCTTVGDVEGYTWRFPVKIQNGSLSGKWVNSADPQNFGVLGGAVSVSGDARLTMGGSTGQPEYNVHHVGLHTPIRWTANAHFDATSGSGKRNEHRPCELSFSKG